MNTSQNQNQNQNQNNSNIIVADKKDKTVAELQQWRIEQMREIQAQGLALFERKNADYGDAFAKYGFVGVLMRIQDKLQRAISITNKGINLVNDEGLKDTLIDLHNYSAMALFDDICPL
jgi:hypothetical protein